MNKVKTLAKDDFGVPSLLLLTKNGTETKLEKVDYTRFKFEGEYVSYSVFYRFNNNTYIEVC